MEKYRNLHIGELIKQKVKESKMPIHQFAKKLCCSRTAVYYIFQTKSIDIDKLILISSVLDYGFLDEYRLDNSSSK